MACRWKGGGEQPDHRVRQFTIEQRRSGESDGWVAAAVSPMSIGACVTAEAVANGIKCYLSETGVFGCEIVRLQSATSYDLRLRALSSLGASGWATFPRCITTPHGLPARPQDIEVPGNLLASDNENLGNLGASVACRVAFTTNGRSHSDCADFASTTALVRWSAPESEGGDPISSYLVQYRTEGASTNWSSRTFIEPGGSGAVHANSMSSAESLTDPSCMATKPAPGATPRLEVSKVSLWRPNPTQPCASTRQLLVLPPPRPMHL
jgi:hypothetical protein